MKNKAKKKEKWIKLRHRIVRDIAFTILFPYCYFKFGARIKPFKERNGRQFIVVFNHTTGFDQFFVGMCFKGAVYYMATEDIFSKGFTSKLLKYLVNPIPIKKQTNDLRAVLNCMHVAREGGTIALAPEGNRTYSGRTTYIKPTIAQLVKKLKLPLAVFRIEGGYGVQPRWSDVIRAGRINCYVSRVVEPEEYAEMSDDELNAIIKEGLFVDEARADAEFKSKKSAEYLERAMYVCPYCGLSEFESRKDTVECKKCGRKLKYLSTTELSGVGFEFPYRFVADWYDYQNAFINKLNVLEHTDSPLYTDNANLFEVIVYKSKKLIEKNVEIKLFGDRVVFGNGTVIPFSEASVFTVLGRNKLNIYHNGKIYQLKGGKRFNSLKYMNIFYRYKNMTEEVENGEFLGI